MSIAEIINEIDAYLFSLRHARNLLSAPIMELPRKKAPRRKRKVKMGKTAAAATSKPRAQTTTSRSGGQASERKTLKERPRVDSAPRVRSSVPRQTAKIEKLEQRPQIEAIKPTPPSAIAPQEASRTEIPSSPNHVRVPRPVHRSAAKPRVRPKVEVAKPAIALAGSMNSKIVVVSAEQARQERNRAVAPPEVRRPRLPSTGLSGKLAFEALFKDAIDPSKSSES